MPFSAKTSCKKCRIIRSIVLVGVMFLVVMMANIDKFSDLNTKNDQPSLIEK